MQYCPVLQCIDFVCSSQLAGVGVASKPLPSDKAKVGADTEDLEARLRQLHN